MNSNKLRIISNIISIIICALSLYIISFHIKYYSCEDFGAIGATGTHIVLIYIIYPFLFPIILIIFYKINSKIKNNSFLRIFINTIVILSIAVWI